MRIVTRRSGRPPLRRVHPHLEVTPSTFGYLDLSRRDLTGVLPEDVQQDEEGVGSSVEDPVEFAAEMASELAEVALNLGAMRIGEVRHGGPEQVQSADLVIDGDLTPGVEPFDELVDGFPAANISVVDRLESAHQRTLAMGTDTFAVELMR